MVEMRGIHRESRSLDYDFHGNNAAFRCPLCHKVFIVSGLFNDRKNGYIRKGVRKCPKCGESKGHCDIQGYKAWLEWHDEPCNHR
jgi:NAD-dependent SIR2 family protein deacetylase